VRHVEQVATWAKYLFAKRSWLGEGYGSGFQFPSASTQSAPFLLLIPEPYLSSLFAFPRGSVGLFTQLTACALLALLALPSCTTPEPQVTVLPSRTATEPQATVLPSPTPATPQGTVLPFETIYEEMDTSFLTSDPVPALKAIISLRHVRALRLDEFQEGGRGPQPELERVLTAVDYDAKVVVVLFLARQPRDRPPWQVLSVTRQENTVYVEALPPPPPGDAEFSFDRYYRPLTVIAIQKEGEWTRGIRFVLTIDGRPVHEHQAWVP
jgi:hypothetical protein